MSESAEPAAPEPPSRRPRGRRPAGGRHARAAIVAAAVEEFAASGYDAVSMRAIARRAAVDPALVHHYFDNQAELFAETIDAPIRPDELLAEVLAGTRHDLGERIVTRLLTEWDRPEVQKRGIPLLRGVVGQGVAATMVREFLAREVIHRLASSIDGGNGDSDDAELRASLAASQLMGLLVTRYVVTLPEVRAASIAELAARVGPVIQFHLMGSTLKPGTDGAPGARPTN